MAGAGIPPFPQGGYLPPPGGLPSEPTEATQFFRVVNAIWPDLLNRKSLIAPARNGVNRLTGMLLQGWDHVEQSMDVIFATGFHERILRRWCGSFVPHILGELGTERIITRFHWAMAIGCDMWEPNYRIQTVYFMGDALQTWEPKIPGFDVSGEFRLGHAFFRTEGSYRPRAHLGDSTPYARRASSLISMGGNLWDPAVTGESFQMVTLVTPTPSRFPVIQPELLQRPSVLESISSDQIITDRITRFKVRWSEEDPPNAAQYDVAQLEFDPIKIVTENDAYFELLIRDRVNQAARSVMLAFAFGTNLDAIASRYPGGMPRIPGESDDNYRRRIWLSPNILGPHGTTESYAFYALSALGANVLRDAAAFTTRGTGIVTIPILIDKPTLALSDQAVLAEVQRKIQTGLVDPLKVSFETSPGDPPLPTNDQILEVYKYVTANTRKGLTDEIVIARPKVYQTRYVISLKTFPGYDLASVLANVGSGLMQLIEKQRWLGYDHTIMAIDGVLNNAGGVYNRIISSPPGDVVVGLDSVVEIKGIDLTWTGVGE